MANVEWPQNFHDLVFFPSVDEKIGDLAQLAEPEEWDYHNVPVDHDNPILYKG